MERTFTRSEMVWAFNEWMRRFTEDPQGFEHSWQSVMAFLSEEPPTYGSDCIVYVEQLLSERYA